MVALMAILSAVAIPQTTAGLDRSRAGIAARYLAGQMSLARSQAIKRSASVGIRFGSSRDGYAMEMFVDGNRNGVLTTDISAGVDRRIATSQRLRDHFPGVDIGLDETAGDGTDPVQVGTSNLLVFTPLGTATSGSVYVLGRDGSQLAVRIAGATARARIQRFSHRLRTWVEVP